MSKPQVSQRSNTRKFSHDVSSPRSRYGRAVNRMTRPRGFAGMENLESRVLLTVTTIADSGNMYTNGTALQTAINNSNWGDIIRLTAGAAYMPVSGGFTLPWKTGTGTIIITSTDVYKSDGTLDPNTHLTAGVRISAAVEPYMPRLLDPGSNSLIMKTVLKDSSGNTVTTGAHGFTLIGLEFMPTYAVANDPTNDNIQSLVEIGETTSLQRTVTNEAHDFTFDRCYIHGLDSLSPTQYMNIQQGLRLDSYNITVSNCEISDIHSTVADSQAVGSSRVDLQACKLEYSIVSPK